MLSSWHVLRRLWRGIQFSVGGEKAVFDMDGTDGWMVWARQRKMDETLQKPRCNILPSLAV